MSFQCKLSEADAVFFLLIRLINCVGPPTTCEGNLTAACHKAQQYYTVYVATTKREADSGFANSASVVGFSSRDPGSILARDVIFKNSRISRFDFLFPHSDKCSVL